MQCLTNVSLSVWTNEMSAMFWTNQRTNERIDMTAFDIAAWRALGKLAVDKTSVLNEQIMRMACLTTMLRQHWGRGVDVEHIWNGRGIW